MALKLKRKASEPAPLVLTRTFDAPPELVFRAWTNPKQMAQWWGPRRFTCPVCELEPKPRGKLNIHMRAPDGSVYPLKGEFHEVLPPERLVFVCSALEFPRGRPNLIVAIRVDFEEESGKTRLSLRAEVTRATLIASGARQALAEGLSQALDRLAEFIAG